MDFSVPKWTRTLLLTVVMGTFTLPGSDGVPRGCGSELDPLYNYLCDLDAVWGVVVEAFAAVGVVICVILFVVTLATLPFMNDSKRRRSVALDATLVVGTLGLFGLSFAFIIGKSFATCSSRRFLFGVLFAACFSCLLMKAVNLNYLSRRNKAPRTWALCLGALVFWLVEVIINTEWLIITMVRNPINTTTSLQSTPVPCNITNQDFVTALVYVMVLIVATLMTSVLVFGGKHRHWYKDGLFILLTALLSVGIWMAWTVMYTYGNRIYSLPTWDDPTLAIALVANGWVFLLFYIIPEMCHATEEPEDEPDPHDFYTTHGLGYENILKEQRTQSVSNDNKAFTMDEPSPVTVTASTPAPAPVPLPVPVAVAGPGPVPANKPMSPYSGYNGQMRSSVYQPTELALITKGLGTSTLDLPYETSIPRASLFIPQLQSVGAVSPTQQQDEQKHIANGNGLHWKPQW